MDSTRRTTRRNMFRNGVAAAMVLGGLALPASSLAKATKPRTRRELDREYSMKVFYKDGKAYKVCYYDQDGSLLYCDSV